MTKKYDANYLGEYVPMKEFVIVIDDFITFQTKLIS